MVTKFSIFLKLSYSKFKTGYKSWFKTKKTFIELLNLIKKCLKIYVDLNIDIQTKKKMP